MPSAERSITINRPINEVFAYIADGENSPEWRSSKIEIRHESGDGVGAIYRQQVPGPMGRSVKADYEITTYTPPTGLSFKAIAGPVRPTGFYKLEPAGQATKLTFGLSDELSGWKKFVFSGSVQKTMDGEMLALDRLKKVLEAQPAPASGSAAKSMATSAPTPAVKAGPKPTSRRAPKK